MQNPSIAKSAILMLFIVISSVAVYEFFLRSSGVNISYDDGKELWSDARAKVYGPSNKQVVFIGSSRIKYDLDIPTWKKLTGLDAVQLACVGSSPRPLLEDLANDPDFKGRLVIDVTEPLFFSDAPHFLETPTKNIKYFRERTYAQKASFFLNNIMESNFVLLDRDNYAMNAQLEALQLPNRQDVFAMPIFPMDFERTTDQRQTYMTERFVGDSAMVNQVRGIWKILMGGKHGPPMTENQIMMIINGVKKSTDKIKARGGEVIFVRTPSSGPFFMGEVMGFPREKYWEQLLKTTACEGIHFLDYPEMAALQCPEFSHLKKKDAIIFTRNFVEILSEKKHWAMNIVPKSTPKNF